MLCGVDTSSRPRGKRYFRVFEKVFCFFVFLSFLSFPEEIWLGLATTVILRFLCCIFLAHELQHYGNNDVPSVELTFPIPSAAGQMDWNEVYLYFSSCRTKLVEILNQKHDM